MTNLVLNCFHWIGYHVVDHLLASGEQVDGIDNIDSSKKEHLSMFFARNSLFKQIQADKRSEYNTIFIIGSIPDTTIKLPAKRIIHITSKVGQTTDKSTTTIYYPLLFGEWMPMNENGFTAHGEQILFDSEDFLREAIYVKDFVKNILLWNNKSSDLPAEIHVRSAHSKKRNEIKLENYVYIQDNGNVQDKVKLVRNHFEKYSYFY